MKRSTAMFLGTALTFFAVLTGCGGSNETSNQANNEVKSGEEAASVKWIANSSWPANNHHSEGLEEFASNLKEVTDGRVELQVQTGGALGFNGPDLLRAVQDGAVPVSDMLTSGVSGDEPLLGVVTLPFLVKDMEEAKLLSEIARPYFDKTVEEKWGQKILYVAPWPGAGFWTKDEVHSLEDMKGLKMRTYDENGALFVEAAGGTPHPLPFSEVYSGLATGVIDSVLTSTPTAVDASFWEVLDYYVPANMTLATNLVTVNLNEFNKLDKETQEIVIQAGKDMEAAMWEKVALLDQEKEKIVNDNGITTLQLSEEFVNELTTVTEDIRKDWLENAPAEALEIVSKFEEQVGRK